jgi:hypothetical protein
MEVKCADCGSGNVLLAPGPAEESEAVKLAKIDSETRIKIAQLQHHDELAVNETAVEIAETQAETEVAVAEVQAEAIAELVAEGEPELQQDDQGDPEIVVVEAEAEPEPDAPPPPDEHHSVPAEPKRSPMSWWPS